MLHRTEFNPALDTPTRDALADFVDWFPPGNTRETYTIHLRLFTDWCVDNDITPFAATRVQIEAFARHLVDDRRNCVGTVRRRMAAISRFYDIAAGDGLTPANPCRHARMPRAYPDSARTTDVYLDRWEMNDLLEQARQHRDPSQAALIALMLLLGLRVHEVIDLDVDSYRHESDGHRLLRFVGKGGKPAALPIPPHVHRLLEAAAGGRTRGPLCVQPNGTRWPYRSVLRLVAKLARDAGISKPVTPHTLRRSFASAGLDAGVGARDMQTAGRWADGRMLELYDKARHSHDRSGVYAVAAFVAGAA